MNNTGAMILIKYMVFILISLVSISASSQVFNKKYPRQWVIDQDTVMCFTMEQSKELAARNEVLKGITKELELCDSQLVVLNETNNHLAIQVAVADSIEVKYELIIAEKDKQLVLIRQEAVAWQEQAKKQRNQKRWAVGIGSAITGLLGYVLIRK